MTPAEHLLFDRIQRRANALSPDLQRALVRAFDRIRVSFSESEITDLVKTGRIDSLIENVFSDEVLNPSLAEFRDKMRGGIVDTTRSFMKDMATRKAPLAFDSLSPSVIEGIRTLETKVMTRLNDDVRATVRQSVRAGLEAGANPRTIARELRTVVGLAPNQEEAVRNFKRMLEGADRDALTRALRDKRFDGTLKKALGADGKGLSSEQIEKMSEAYRKRMVAFNAETQSRTAALDAQKLGQRLSWKQAVDQGTVSAERLMKRRVVTMDGRQRDEHGAMNGEVRQIDEPYSNGEVISGDNSWNCRCVDSIFVASDAFLASTGAKLVPRIRSGFQAA